MNQSDKLDLLATALAKAQASLSAAKKDRVNPHFKNHYATLESIWEAAREVLAPNGLSIVQTFDATDGRLMNIRTTLMHSSGQWIAGVLSMAPQQATPQGIGSAITYGRRYSLGSILGIVSEEDDDGNLASQDHAESERAPTHQPAPYRAPTASGPSKVTGWRGVTVPKFIKKFAGQKLSDMPQEDLMWWADNYTPKPFGTNPEPSDADIAFKESLLAAKADMIGQEPEQMDVPF